jgi:hypothetical protein
VPAKPASAIPGSFAHGEVGFVCDTHFTDATVPGATAVSFPKFAEALQQSGRLPNTGSAPVSAWVLARLAFLSGSRFPFCEGEVCGSDLDEYWIPLIAFTTGGKIVPAGKVSVRGGRSHVRLDAHAAPPHTPAQIRDAFMAALLESPDDLGQCRIVVAYTDTAREDKYYWQHVPFTLGWDGSQFIYHDSPEHGLTPEDYEL